jgi:DNA-binding NtrC family response regulator
MRFDLPCPGQSATIRRSHTGNYSFIMQRSIYNANYELPHSMKLTGNSTPFTELLQSLQVTAQTDASVLLLGESGTGKELLAQFLHQHSRRQARPFVAINCAALPEALVESALFGHRKGAFTGAIEHHQGHIQQADGGTLFLDEVAEMSLPVQAKLLRFLESGEFQPVGESLLQRADIRLVAATHADLAQRVDSGRFRADLYYRLNVVPFVVPPLRERTGDIPLLIEGLSQQLAQQHKLSPCRYSPAVLHMLAAYAWPGNIRELRNLCERMLVLYAGQQIQPQHLPAEFMDGGMGQKQNRRHAFKLPESGIRLDELEKDLLQQALHKTAGNQSKAARLLGLTRDAFLYRLKKYSIAGTGFRERAGVTI